jgi:hypothetical protein
MPWGRRSSFGRFRTGSHNSAPALTIHAATYRGRRPYSPRDREKRADTLFARRTITAGHKRGVPAVVRWPMGICDGDLNGT